MGFLETQLSQLLLSFGVLNDFVYMFIRERLKFKVFGKFER